MENLEKIEDKIKMMSEYDIVPKKKSPIAAAGFTVIGVALAILGSTEVIKGDILEMTFMSIGTIVALYGLFRLLMVCQKDAVDYVYAPTGKKLRAHKIYISADSRIKVDKCIENNDYSKMKNLGKENSSNNMLHIYGSEDGEIAVFQVMEYVPHFFEPASAVVLVRGSEAKYIHEFINQK